MFLSLPAQHPSINQGLSLELAFIDHYDSFSFNVLDWLDRAGGGNITLKRIVAGDEASLARLKYSPIPVVISPGPGKPKDYPMTMETIRSIMGKVPILGICLGHQMLGELAGGKIVKAKNPWHGTSSTVRIVGKNWFTDQLPETFKVICYNSLVIDSDSLPKSDWKTLGINEDGEVMVMSHTSLPIASVQFHPESFASECGMTIAKNFIERILPS